MHFAHSVHKEPKVNRNSSNSQMHTPPIIIARAGLAISLGSSRSIICFESTGAQNDGQPAKAVHTCILYLEVSWIHEHVSRNVVGGLALWTCLFLNRTSLDLKTAAARKEHPRTSRPSCCHENIHSSCGAHAATATLRTIWAHHCGDTQARTLVP